MEVAVRRATREDLERISSLLDQLGESVGDRALAWEQLCGTERYFAFVAELGRSVVGFVDVLLFPDVLHGGNLGLVLNLVVDEKHRRKGIRKLLLRKAIETAKSRGAVELHVWTEEGNAAARALYEKLGFEKRGLLYELELA